jgi:hypothetical protein
MKKLLFLLALASLFVAITPPTEATAQTRYGPSTFPLDSLYQTETINYYLPGTYGDDDIKQAATWQVRMTRIADTMTVSIYLEETIDETATGSSPTSGDWVTVATVANAVVLNATTTELKYLYHTPIRGKMQRLRFVSSGSLARAQVEVDAWRRDKVPLMITDEY